MPRQYFELKGISYIEFSTEIRCVLLGKSSTVLGIFENINSKVVQDERKEANAKAGETKMTKATHQL